MARGIHVVLGIREASVTERMRFVRRLKIRVREVTGMDRMRDGVVDWGYRLAGVMEQKRVSCSARVTGGGWQE